VTPARIDFDDLPKRTRKQIRGLLADRRPAPRIAGEPKAAGETPKGPADRVGWRCTTCDTAGDTLAGLERHADNSRHFRFDTLR
jgi:hypothetical protein